MGRHKTIPRQQLLVKYAFQRELQGGLIFDFEKDHYRSARYLLRNIKRVLRHHEKRLSKTTRTKSTELNQVRTNSFNHAQPSNLPLSFGGSSSDTNLSDPQRVSVKQDDEFPTFAEYAKEDSVTVYTPNFKTSSQLRLGQAAFLLNITHLRAKSNSNAAPLFHFYRTQPSRYTISVSLSNLDSDDLLPVARHSRECALTMDQSGKSIHVSLEKPFQFGIKVAMGSKYHMEIWLSPARDDKRPWPPVTLTTRAERSPLSLIPDPQLQIVPDGLVATYPDLPLFKRTRERLRLMYISDGTAFKTRYALEVSIDWVAEAVTQTQRLFNMETRTYPTSFSGFARKKQGMATLKAAKSSRVITSYTLASTDDKKIATEWRKMSFRGFHCPCCLRVHSDFDGIVALRFHLITAHAAHNFAVQEVVPSIHGKDIEYNITVSAPRRKPDRITYFWLMTWIAPSTPFNASAYVDGDESWLGPKSTHAIKVPVPTNENPLATLRRKHNGMLPVQYVEEIPFRQRKKYPVVPTKTRDQLPIFTSVTHRQLQPDEELSESDDDVDEAWLRDKHAQQIMDMTHLPLDERRFQIRWNDHVRSEGLPHTFYLSDMFVRWVRKDREWLRSSKERLNLYHRFERGLYDRGKISDLVARGCWGILYGKVPAEDQ